MRNGVSRLAFLAVYLDQSAEIIVSRKSTHWQSLVSLHLRDLRRIYCCSLGRSTKHRMDACITIILSILSHSGWRRRAICRLSSFEITTR